MKTINLPGAMKVNALSTKRYQRLLNITGEVSTHDNQADKHPGSQKWHFVSLVLLILILLTFGNTSWGQDTGLMSPTTSQVIAGNAATILAVNALTSNNQYASFTASGDAAGYGGFSLSIPAGVTIVGIQVQLEGNRTTTFQTQRDLNISLTWDNGTTYTAETTMTRFTSTNDATVSVGGATSTWGRTWVASELTNANFGVKCRVPSTANNNINIDLIQVRVYYTCSTPAPTVTSAVAYCQNDAATQLSATGTDLLWYTQASGGTGSSTAPTPVTTTAGTTSYWVSQTIGCEGPRAKIDVTVHSRPVSAVIAQTNITCNGAHDGTITVAVASGGTAPYQFSIDEGASFQGPTTGTTTSLFTGLYPGGPYKIIVKDNYCASR
jgi:hypothetical protein